MDPMGLNGEILVLWKHDCITKENPEWKTNQVCINVNVVVYNHFAKFHQHSMTSISILQCMFALCKG